MLTVERVSEVRDYFYRFRPIKYLLEHPYDELQNQEIRFSSPDELNDYMEAFGSMSWHGDTIVWTNLLRHYLYCLEAVYTPLIFGDNGAAVDASIMPIFGKGGQFGDMREALLYRTICGLFFRDPFILEYIEKLSLRVRPIQRPEFSAHLKNLHWHALHAVITACENHSFIRKGLASGTLTRLCADATSEPLDELNRADREGRDVNSAVCEVFAPVIRRFFDRGVASRLGGLLSSNDVSNNLLLRDFPDQYVRRLARLVHPDFYVACFSGGCRSPLMWGHYGGGGRSVCLKFRARALEDRPFITLHGMVWDGTGVSQGEIERELLPVQYEDVGPEIDFFRSLGLLTEDVLTWWYTSEEGLRSPCWNSVHDDIDQWTQAHWERSLRRMITKLRCWSYETEYRLIVGLGPFDTPIPDDRKFRYEWSDLDGVIFGVNTTEKDKAAIRRIIREKCAKEGRDGFDFYQAVPASNGDIECLLA